MIFHKHQESTRIKQIPTFDLPKIQRFHADPTLCQNGKHIFNNIFRFIRICLFFGFCKNNEVPHIFQHVFWKLPFKTLGGEYCFGGNSQNKKHKISTYFGVRWCPKMSKSWIFGMSTYFLRSFREFLVFFLKYFDDKYGVYRSTKNEKFGSSRNHLKSIAIGRGTLISHSGIIQTPETSKKQ